MKRSGFTLLELLLVMAILIIVIAIVAPAASTIIRGNRVSQAAQTVVDQMGLARQLALTRNHNVEMRFYRFADPEAPTSASSFRALQIFDMVSAAAAVPAGKMQMLPPRIIADSSANLSSLFDPGKRSVRAGVDPLPRVGTNYQYAVIRFRPDGSTDLLPTAGSWFLTLHDEATGDALSQPPANFVTVEVDPANGVVQLFRPGV